MMGTVDDGLSIGEFSRVTHLSIRRLRRYHDGGLLVPAMVDPVTGYRWYTLEQVPLAQAVRRFRDLGLPTAELRELLAASDDGRRDDIVVAHLDRLEEQLADTRAAITSLRALLGPRRTTEVVTTTLPAQPVLAVRAVVAEDDVLDWYAAARAELDALVVAADRTEPPGGRYDHELFTHGRGPVLIYTPCADSPGRAGTAAGRVERLTLPARTLAVATHHGPHDDIDLTYALLGSWVMRRGVGTDGPLEEIYDVGPDDDPHPDAWRTRLAWPVSVHIAGPGDAS